MIAIIIDDEPKSIKLLKSFLERSCPEVNVIASSTVPQEAMALIRQHKPDVLFVDIDMPLINGIELVSAFNENDFAVIYVTAYDHFAIQAVKTNAVDYLLKPVKEKDLILAVNKAAKRIKQNAILNGHSSKVSSTEKNSRIALPSMDGFTLVDVNSIIRCQSDGCYTSFYLLNSEKILVSYNIGEYEKYLESFGFVRIHNSHLINLAHVKKYKKGRGGTVIMMDDEEIDVSVRKKKELMDGMQVKVG